VAAVAAAVVIAAVMAIPAHAGAFQQYLGTAPNGSAVPAGPWSGLTYGSTGPGHFGVQMPANVGGGWTSTATLSPAPNLPWASATAQRTYDLPVSSAVYQPRATTTWETVGWISGGYGGASSSGAVSVSHPSSLSITVGCYSGMGGSDPNPRCTGGGIWWASQIVLTVNDADNPTGSLVDAGGELLNGQWHTSTSIPLKLTAADVGSGAYRAWVRDASNTYYYALLDPGSSRCRDLAPGQGSDYQFAASQTSLVPCTTASTEYTPEFDLSGLGDGEHTGLTVGIEDAAGNQRVLASGRTVRLNLPGGSLPDAGTTGPGGCVYGADGTCAPPTTPPVDDGASGIVTPSPGGGGGGGGGPTKPEAPKDPAPAPPNTQEALIPGPALGPNGHGASPNARLTSSANGAKGAKIVTRYGKTVTITGRLVDPSGSPIADATLDVTSTAIGQRPLSLPSAKTNADGRYTLTSQAHGSRIISVGYRSNLNSSTFDQTSQVAIVVKPAVRLSTHRKVLRNGQAARFKGRVLGAPSDSRKAVSLQAKVNGKWKTFATTRLRNGRFTYAYRFQRTTITSVYQFRARVLNDGSNDPWPFASGHSKTARVKVVA